MATLKPVKQKKSGEKWTSSIFALDPAAAHRVHPALTFFPTCSDFWLDFPPVVRMACEIKLLESEATTGFFVLLGEQGNKAVLSWVMKEGLISSRYECPKCKKCMRLVERKGTIDGFEWRCRVQSKENPHFVCRSVRKAPNCQVADVAGWYRYRIVACLVMSSSPVPLKTRHVGQRCTLNLSRAETSPVGVVARRGGASSGVVHVT
ncbi:uncharacterized protein TNCV_3289671 [Trichonephila clavipes]|nr:uncharacterized protein TNCV_3289671 [Trichonephila clavipes]